MSKKHNVVKNNKSYSYVPKKSATLGSYLNVRNSVIAVLFITATSLSPSASQLIGNGLNTLAKDTTADSNPSTTEYEDKIKLSTTTNDDSEKSNSSTSDAKSEAIVTVTKDGNTANETSGQSTHVTITSSSASQSTNDNSESITPEVTINGESVELPKNGRYRERTDDGITETDVKLDIDIDNNSNTSFKINTNIGGN